MKISPQKKMSTHQSTHSSLPSIGPSGSPTSPTASERGFSGTASLQNSKLSINSKPQSPQPGDGVEEPTFLEKAKFYTSLCLGEFSACFVHFQPIFTTSHPLIHPQIITHDHCNTLHSITLINSWQISLHLILL